MSSRELNNKVDYKPLKSSTLDYALALEYFNQWEDFKKEFVNYNPVVKELIENQYAAMGIDKKLYSSYVPISKVETSKNVSTLEIPLTKRQLLWKKFKVWLFTAKVKS